METIVVRIPSGLARELEQEAKELRLTKSEVARRRLSAGSNQGQSEKEGYALIADLVGSVKDMPKDLSQNRKDYLKATGYGK